VGENLGESLRHRPPREERLRRLGLPEEYASSYLALASAYDAVTEAEVALEGGSPEVAMEMLAPVAESGQRYARYLLADQALSRALAAQRGEKPDEALLWFETVLRHEPDRLEGLAGVGYLELFRGNLERADALLTRAVELYPRSAGAIWRLAAVRYARGEAGEAEGLLRAAIERSPALPEPWSLLGAIRLGREDFAGALEAFDAALARGDRSEGTRKGREEADRGLGRG
jgi:tetratricopeptide (TPR) repeat protein